MNGSMMEKVLPEPGVPASKGIDNVYPSLSKLTLIIVAHEDIHTVVIGLQVLALFKTLVLEVEMVFQQSFLQEHADVVQGYMHQYHTNDGCCHI